MKNSILLLIVACAISYGSRAQVATNFTTNDCDGNYHDLFAELDEGKVIVLCWVMPCGTCTGPALTAYHVVESHQSSSPGKVLFYMIDDYANTNCASLDSWANSKNIPKSNFSLRFSDASIKMTDYGAVGMPKTVVVGGSGHKVYLNSNNALDLEELVDAVDLALIQLDVEEIEGNFSNAVIFPNPAGDNIKLSLHAIHAGRIELSILDITGKIIATRNNSTKSGENIFSLETADLAAGIYFIKITGEGRDEVHKLVLTK